MLRNVACEEIAFTAKSDAAAKTIASKRNGQYDDLLLLKNGKPLAKRSVMLGHWVTVFGA